VLNCNQVAISTLQPFKGPGDQGYEKLRFSLKKAHSCVNPRRLSHFAWRSVRGSDLQWCAGKSQIISDSHRNDVSPLTQGLRYRAACDTETDSRIWNLIDCCDIFVPAFKHFTVWFVCKRGSGLTETVTAYTGPNFIPLPVGPGFVLIVNRH